MKPLKSIAFYFDWVLDFLALVAGAIIIFTMLGVCVNVIMRYFFNRPIVGVDEVTGYLLLYVTFLGAAWLLKNEGHVAVDFVVLRFGPKGRAFISIVSSIIGIVICLALVWYGSKVTWESYKTHGYLGTVLEIPKAPIFLLIPLGSLLLLIQFVRQLFAKIREFRN